MSAQRQRGEGVGEMVEGFIVEVGQREVGEGGWEESRAWLNALLKTVSCRRDAGRWLSGWLKSGPISSSRSEGGRWSRGWLKSWESM